VASGSRARPRPGRLLLSQPGARWDAYRRSAASEAPGPQRQPVLSRRWRGILLCLTLRKRAGLPPTLRWRCNGLVSISTVTGST
jgi:hypothetical protein